MKKTESGRVRIRAALELEDIAGNGVKSLHAPLDIEKDAQAVEYYTLLLDNVNHFQSQGKAVDSYRGYHTKALNAAAAGMELPQIRSLTTSIPKEPDLSPDFSLDTNKETSYNKDTSVRE